jgi:hypothetical protein
VGYTRTRWDLGLEPRLWVTPPHAAQRLEAYFGAGFGVTLPSDDPPLHRAYTETIDSHPGYYLMPRVGGSFQFAKYVCLYLELGYAFHVTELDATLEPKIPNMPRTVEERSYVDHLLIGSFGFTSGFGEIQGDGSGRR